MPSSPNFDDAMFILRVAWKTMVEKAKPESECTEKQREVSSMLVGFYGTLGQVFEVVRANGDLPTNTERRARRLFELYKETLGVIATTLSRAEQKPAEN